MLNTYFDIINILFHNNKYVWLVVFSPIAPDPRIPPVWTVSYNLLCAPDRMCAKFHDDSFSSLGMSVTNKRTPLHIYNISNYVIYKNRTRLFVLN